MKNGLRSFSFDRFYVKNITAFTTHYHYILLVKLALNYNRPVFRHNKSLGATGVAQWNKLPPDVVVKIESSQ